MKDNGVKYIEYTLFVSILASLLLKLALLLHLKIGWDEFFYLSKIYDFQRGTLTGSFQNFHVHLFQWLPLVSANEVTQVLWARGVMFLLFLGSCRYFYLIGRFFLNRPATLFALLCYLSLSNIVVHGASFRYDSIGSFLFLAAFYHLLKAPFRSARVIIAASLMALSLVLSIKASFHIVTLVCLFAVFYLIQEKPLRAFRSVGLFLTVLLLVFFALFRFHTGTLPDQAATTSGHTNFLASVFNKVISVDTTSVGLHYLGDTYIKNTFIWALFVLGAYLTARASVTGKSRRLHLLSLTALIPFATLFFYRNSFPYYYVFIIAPGFILCGVMVNNLIEDRLRKGARAPLAFVYLLIVAVLAGSAVHYTASFHRPLDLQRRLIQQIHRIFPEPVAYIDGCSAVSSYQKVGLFMSTWGMQTYLNKGQPVMRELISSHQPKFLLANIPSLDLSLPRENSFTEYNYALLPEDWETLRNNFIHYWNILYVPGKEFSFEQQPYSRTFEILVSGTYTLQGNVRLTVDGQFYDPGDTLYLSQGDHRIVVPEKTDRVRLRWGSNLHDPGFRMGKPNFYGFAVVSF